MSDSSDEALQEHENELKRCISRLSFVGMGLSKPMDKALNELRLTLKDESSIELIKEKVDRVSLALRTIEDRQNKSKIEIAQDELAILKLLLKSKIPSNFKSSLKRLKRSSQKLSSSEINQQIILLIEQFSHGLPALQQGKPSFFQRLFGMKPSDEAQALIQSALPEVPESLRNTLLHLVEQLSVIESNIEVAGDLSTRVQELADTTELTEILEIVTNSLVEFAEHEHEQFESFLKSLAKRIDKVNLFIQHSVEYNQQFQAESHQLDNDLKDSVSHIKNSLESSDSLVAIKQGLVEKMDSIVSRVNLFCTMQAKGQEKLTQDVESLQEQLRATEDRTLRLKEELAAQKNRAQTDPLTGLPNRYSYNDRLTQEYNRWRRYRSPLSLVVGDIDHFKQINDKFGHDAGDHVLKAVARYLSDAVRESDFIARFGGEEFILLLPETKITDAAKAINKLRLGIKELTISYDSESIPVAISFGISEFDDDDTPRGVFNRADKALYRAKEMGRDQVCCQRANQIEN